MFKIVRVCVLVSAVFAACAASGVTATKEWVQSATNTVLQQARSYADGKVATVNGKSGPNVRLDVSDLGGGYGISLLTTYVASMGPRVLVGDNRYGEYDQAGVFYGGQAGGIRGNMTTPRVDQFALSWPWGWGGIIATSNMVESVVSPIASSQATDHATISAWQTYWDGDDVRVTVTNYYGQTGMPRLYLEEKMQPDGDHAEPWFKTVWDEATRWNAFLSDYLSVTNFVRQNLADRAWGVYDSSSGAYSPDDLLQLSQSSIQIAAGMAWQKTVLTSGSVWVLKATTPATIAGTAANGFMRLLDGDGNTMVEIIKGDKRIVGATATALEMQGTRMRVTYSVTSSDHPTMSLCTDLADPNWVEEGAAGAPASVAWSGSSGAWVATVTPIGNRPSMFARATYETGGSTYLNAAVPIGFSKVVIGGHEYSVTVETVSGKRVMVLQ